VLLDSSGADVIAAGDILADGIEVAASVRHRVVTTLFAQLSAEDPTAPDALRVLVELSTDPAVAGRLDSTVDDARARPWVRAVIADALDEADGGVRAHRVACDRALPFDVRRWAGQRLPRRNPRADIGELGPSTGASTADGDPTDSMPSGVLALYAYRRALADGANRPEYRLVAALRLAELGAPDGAAAVRGCLFDSALRIDLRLQSARALRDLGPDWHEELRELASSASNAVDLRAACAVALAEVSDEVGRQVLVDLDAAEPALRDRLPAVRAALNTTDLPAADTFPGRRDPVGPAAIARAAPTRSHIWGDVPPRHPYFTGREALLNQLHATLGVARAAALLPSALHGMGGVGKSQLATEYVYRHNAEFDLVWWIPSEQPGLILSSLTKLAQRLGLDATFDNADDPHEVRPFFPIGGTGTILVTSRNPRWAELSPALEVDVFTRDESVAFLDARTRDLSQADADRLADALGDLPLAVKQAAAWRAATGMPVDEYLELLRNKRFALVDDPSVPSYQNSIAAAWNISLDKLDEVNRAALQLLQVCSFFAPEPISREVLAGSPIVSITPELDETLSDPIRLARAIRDILRYALARFDHRNGTLQIHRLVRAVVFGRMDPAQRDVMRRGAHTLLANGDPNMPSRRSRWSVYQSLRPHLIASRAVESADPRVQDLVFRMVEFLYHWGDHEGCERLAAEAYEQRLSQLGEAHQQTLRLTKYLGYIRWVLGRYPEAERLNQRGR
jgi:hypothetical protein